MRKTLARWKWGLWIRPMSPRAFAANVFCFLFPKYWLNMVFANTHQWDEIEMNFLDLMVDPSKAALDVGANTGKYAYRLSALLPKVYAFEPDPALAAKINRALPRNVEVHAAAISNKCGVARLMFPVVAGHRVTAISSIEPGVLSATTPTMSIEVPTIRLDDFGLEPIGFIKIDVEGHELSVLEGAVELIARERPIIMVEAEDRHKYGAVSLVRSFMEARGFDGFFVLDDAVFNIEEFTIEMQTSTALSESETRMQMRYVNNFIFVPRERASTFLEGMRDALIKRGVGATLSSDVASNPSPRASKAIEASGFAAHETQ